MLAQDYFTLRLVRLKAAEGWSLRRDGLCVLFPKGGEGSFVNQSQTYPLSAGDVLVANSTAGFELRAGDVDLVFWSFSLRLDHFYPLFAGHEIALIEAVTESFGAAKLFAGAEPLAKQCHRLIEDIPPQFNLDHRSQLLRVASAILTEEFKAAHERRAGALGVEAHLVQIFEELSSEELLTISVGDLATKFNCSRRHLNRLFHHYFGFSVAALRMEMRLLKAVSVLRDGNTKIIHVAEQCGFNHLGLFNTCFKRRFGVSPGQWRKQTALAHGDSGVEDDHGMCPLHSKGLCPLTTPEGGLAMPPSASSLLKSRSNGAGKHLSIGGPKPDTKSSHQPSQNGGSNGSIGSNNGESNGSNHN